MTAFHNDRAELNYTKSQLDDKTRELDEIRRKLYSNRGWKRAFFVFWIITEMTCCLRREQNESDATTIQQQQIQIDSLNSLINHELVNQK